MSVIASAIVIAFAKIMAIGGVVLFFRPLLSGIARALVLWVRLKLSRQRTLGPVAGTSGQ